MKNRVEQLIKTMTLKEKAMLCTGKDFWNLNGVEDLSIPSIMVTDGPHGVRKQSSEADHIGLNESVKSTCFPTAAGLAATWDIDLMERIGVALGETCKQEKVSILLGPGANIKRSPLCGRNFEYFSEDPYLTGKMSAAMIRGVQSQGIGTSLKHFAANNQESNRMTINAYIDERTLRELYLTGFEIAVKESQPWTLMSSYNMINGVYAGENEMLLRDILKNEWEHEGFVVTDWGACNDRVKGLKAGLELDMPGNGGESADLIVDAVNKGELDIQVLDESVRRILKVILKAEAALKSNEDFKCDVDMQHKLARKAAADSMVLLKNDIKTLPLKSIDNILLVGEFAVEPRYQGAGSSLINPIKLDTAYNSYKERFGIEPNYARGYDVSTDKPDFKLISEACNKAKKFDVVIIMAGLTDDYESEGFDRNHMKMPESHNKLIEEVSRVNKNVVVVLCNGSAVEMPWNNKVSSIIEAYLGGQAAGSAMWDVLLGEVNPNGKLAETFPIRCEDNPSHKYFPMGPRQVEYREGLYVGYRYYESTGTEVLYPFGHGLSYTNFEYSDLVVENSKDIYESSADDINLNKYDMKVKVTVANVGKIEGAEVVQLYVCDIASTVYKPHKELKRFRKIKLAPGEAKRIVFTLDKRSFAHYDVESQDWVIEQGEYKIMVGASSADIRQSETVYIYSEHNVDTSKKVFKETYNVYKNPCAPLNISRESFIRIMDSEILDIQPHTKGNYNKNTTITEIKDSLLGKLMYNKLQSQIKDMVGDDKKQLRMMEAMISEMPLRGLSMMSGGKMNGQTIDVLIHALNGKPISAVAKAVQSKKNK